MDDTCKQIKAEKVIKQQPYDMVQSMYGMETSRQHIYPYIIFTKDSLYSISFSKYGLSQFLEWNFNKINVDKKIILDLVQNFHIVIIGITKNKVIVNKQLVKKSTYDAITKKYPNAKVNIITGSIIFN